MIVADTNLIAYLLIVGEKTEEAREVFRRDPDWIAPVLWRSELSSVLLKCVRLEQISLDHAIALNLRAQQLIKRREFAIPTEQVLRLGEASGCSSYYCEFVVLAQTHRIPLVTSDKQVLRAFPGTAVSPSGFLTR